MPSDRNARCAGWVGRLGGLFLIMTLAVSLVGPTSASAEARRARNISPALTQILDGNPNGTLRVIVQGQNANGELQRGINVHGGLTMAALPIIKALAAELPAGKVRALASDPNVQWVTVDAPMVPTFATNAIATTYPFAVGAPEVWNGPTPYTGLGVTVAVLDSGLNLSGNNASDFGDGRVVETVVTGRGRDDDRYGHGTHVAGIIGSSGKGAAGKYVGIAPEVNLLSVKVSDDKGAIRLSDVIQGMQWVIQNRAKHNIRVVNLSLISSVPESYLTNPLSAAVEVAWLAGITVVVSAGNLGTDSAYFPPANDPLVITVGAVDNNGTAAFADDEVPSWSSYGLTQEGYAKPEVAAPGRQIVSNTTKNGVLWNQLPDRRVDENYLRLSGTSMSAAVVSGIAALTVQAHPTWTPDQIKGGLMSTARTMASPGAGRGEVDAAALVALANADYANSGVTLNHAVANLVGMLLGQSATWNSATWNSATWNSATWNSATWNSATWNSATWNSATWNSATWNSATWNSATWNSVTWNSFPD